MMAPATAPSTTSMSRSLMGPSGRMPRLRSLCSLRALAARRPGLLHRARAIGTMPWTRTIAGDAWLATRPTSGALSTVGYAAHVVMPASTSPRSPPGERPMMACGSMFLQEATIRDNLMMSAHEAATNVDIVMFPGILEADMETRPLGHGKLEADHPDLPAWTTRSAARARRPPMTRLWILLTGSARHTPHACTTSPITARHRQADRRPSRRPHQAQGVRLRLELS